MLGRSSEFLAKAQVLDCQLWHNLESLILSIAIFFAQSCPLVLLLSPPPPLVYKLNSAYKSDSFLQWAVAVSKWQPIFTVLFIISCFLKIQERFPKVSGVGGLNCLLYTVSLSFLQGLLVEKWRRELMVMLTYPLVSFISYLKSSFFHLFWAESISKIQTPVCFREAGNKIVSVLWLLILSQLFP